MLPQRNDNSVQPGATRMAETLRFHCTELHRKDLKSGRLSADLVAPRVSSGLHEVVGVSSERVSVCVSLFRGKIQGNGSRTGRYGPFPRD
jgi:hypothetical protein